MKRITLMTLLGIGLLVAAGMLQTSTAGMQPGQEISPGDFVGVWELLQAEGPDHVFNEQHGLMMVYDNYVCHMHAADDRVAPVKDDSPEVKAEKRAKLFGQTTAACGTFEMKEGKITVNWTTSNDPGKEGHETDFVLTREGDRIKLALARVPDFKYVYKRVD